MRNVTTMFFRSIPESDIEGLFREHIQSDTVGANVLQTWYPPNVADYLDRVRAISKATEPNDPVFSTIKGETAVTLYHGPVESRRETGRVRPAA